MVLAVAVGAVAPRGEGLGANTVMIVPGSPNLAEAEPHLEDLTMDAATALGERGAAPHIAQVAPMAVTSGVVAAGGASAVATITGTTPNYFALANSTIAVGEVFREDSPLGENAAVIGDRLATDLFSDTNPIGQTVDVGKNSFTVVGVLASPGPLDALTVNLGLFIPLSQAEQFLTPRGQLTSIAVQAIDSDSVEAACVEAREIVAGSMGFAPEEATFLIVGQPHLAEAATRTGAVASAMLAAIAAICLTFGGIGLTAIMLTAVARRAREIAIRRTLGASRAAIAAQVIVESTIWAVAGGALGTALALTVDWSGFIGVPLKFAGWSVALAAGVAVGIGVLFGAYPAARAFKLMASEALRH
jgi:putative ABC transport system permease protein